MTAEYRMTTAHRMVAHHSGQQATPQEKKMTNSTDKTISRGEYLTTALQLADSYLKLYVTSYYVADITSVDSRYQRNHTWHPVAQQVADTLTSADMHNITARQMAVLCYHHNWAQVMLRIAGRAEPVILTWHESEWHEGDILN